MKITNPFSKAEITIDSNGNIEAWLEAKIHAKVVGKDLKDSWLIRSMHEIVTAPYLNIYPEDNKKDK